MLHLRHLSVLAAACAAPATAQLATGSIQHENVVYEFSSFPTGPSSTGGLGNMRVTGAGGQDHLYQCTWYYKIAGDPAGSAFNNGTQPVPPQSIYAGDRVIHLWPDADGRGMSAEWVVKAASTGSNRGMVIHRLTVANNTAAPLAIDLYGYVDFDQCGTTSNTTGASSTANHHYVAASTCAPVTEIRAPNALAYEAGTFPNVRTSILAGNPLSGAGLPFGPADYTAGWQWTATLGASQSTTVYLVLSTDFTHTGNTQAAAASTYGTAKPGTNGAAVLSALSCPLLGAAADIVIDNGLAGAAPIGLIGSGRANLNLGIATLLVNPAGLVIVALAPFGPTRVSRSPVRLPNARVMAGAMLNVQAAFGDAGAAGGLAHTDGLEWVLGGVF